jgi:Cu(I)/Ag(I) efflux system membrane fusion protein
MSMASGAGSSQPVFANGVVEAVNEQTRRIRVSHGPIEDLGWAAMTMEFDVLPGVDLGALRVGQNIHFELGQSDVGDYQINIIRPESSRQVEAKQEDEL